MSTVTMYEAIDIEDGLLSLFAFKDDLMAVASESCRGDWKEPDLFNFEASWKEEADKDRMVNPKLLWTSGTCMYKAVDKGDGSDSLFAVRGEKMRVSFYGGTLDPWMSPNGFEEVIQEANLWMPVNVDRMINPELIWET